MAERTRVGILISGRGSTLSALVTAAQAPGCPYEVALVFSNVADAPGLAIAGEAGVPTASLDNRGHGGRALFDAKVDAILRDAGSDLVALAGPRRLLSDDFVSRWAVRVTNHNQSRGAQNRKSG